MAGFASTDFVIAFLASGIRAGVCLAPPTIVHISGALAANPEGVVGIKLHCDPCASATSSMDRHEIDGVACRHGVAAPVPTHGVCCTIASPARPGFPQSFPKSATDQHLPSAYGNRDCAIDSALTWGNADPMLLPEAAQPLLRHLIRRWAEAHLVGA